MLLCLTYDVSIGFCYTCTPVILVTVAANVDLWQLGVEMTTTRLMLN